MPDFWPVLPGAEPIDGTKHTGVALVDEMRGVWIEAGRLGLRWDVSFVRADGMQNRGGTDYWYQDRSKNWRSKLALARAAAALALLPVLWP